MAAYVYHVKMSAIKCTEPAIARQVCIRCTRESARTEIIGN